MLICRYYNSRNSRREERSGRRNCRRDEGSKRWIDGEKADRGEVGLEAIGEVDIGVDGTGWRSEWDAGWRGGQGSGWRGGRGTGWKGGRGKGQGNGLFSIFIIIDFQYI